jgi:hypothetical protein
MSDPRLLDRTCSIAVVPRLPGATIRTFLCAAALALLALPGAGLAFSRCVTTAQELTQALDDARTTADQNTGIKIAAGTYMADDGFDVILMRASQFVLITGGWSKPDCATRLVGPQAATTVVGGASSPALYVAYNQQSGNIVTLGDLTLSNPGYSEFGHGCLSAHVPAGNILGIGRARIEQCAAPFGSAVSITNYGEVNINNLAVTDNPTADTPVDIRTYDGGVARLSQITLVHDDGQQGIYLATFGTGSQALLSNSVVWSGGTAAGSENILTAGSGITLTRVHYELRAGQVADDNTPSHGDPGFVSPTDRHLRADSILVDSGVASPAGGTGSYDADYNPRVQGVAVDVGAYEYFSTTIFADGFDQ